jgi:outer membrane lipoprotein-sorting protein
MKSFKTILFTCLMLIALSVNAQTAEEIIENYFENTGGKAKWESLKGLKMIGSANAQGMKIPVEMLTLKDGKTMLTINFQGQEIKQGVYDGNVLWSTNFMTQSAEASDKESTDNYKKNEAKEFPDPFLNYKKNGYKIELLGKETKEGAECFKIKLTKNPIMVDGKEEENSTIYFFDTENFVPIALDSEAKQGPMKGQVFTSTMSDYEEFGGLYFPTSMSQGGQPITIESIELNPSVDDSVFKMPVQEETAPADNN